MDADLHCIIAKAASSSCCVVHCRFHALQVEGFICEGDVECMQVPPSAMQIWECLTHFTYLMQTMSL